MTLADFATDRPVQFTPAHRFGSVFQWLAARRAARAKRVALQSLLFAPEHRLRDLGSVGMN